MLSAGDIALRGVNFAFLVIALGLTASLAATTITQHNSRVNFAVFAAAWGLLTSSFYGLAAFFVGFLGSPLFLVILDFLNFVFTFSAATALAVGTRTHSCSNQTYLDENNIAQGSKTRCQKAQASTAFLYFSFFIFLASLIIQIFTLMKNGLFAGSASRPAKTGVPTLSQV